MLFTSTKTGEGIDEIKHILEGRTTTVAGPSGVGKSSIINCLQDDVQMETGHISEKIERGKHTTRPVSYTHLYSRGCSRAFGTRTWHELPYKSDSGKSDKGARLRAVQQGCYRGF